MLLDSLTVLFVLPSTLTLVRDLIGLLILWIIVSIPVYLAAKLLTGGRARFSRAMIATLIGPIVFALVLVVGFVITSAIAGGLGILALFLAFIAWIWVFKGEFRTGWIQALGIAILSVIVGVVLIALLELAGLMFHNVLLVNLAMVIPLLN
jgi:hypothetical protein